MLSGHHSFLTLIKLNVHFNQLHFLLNREGVVTIFFADFQR